MTPRLAWHRIPSNASKYIHYTTSKGGAVGFTRSLARELGEFGIRVNSIASGFTLSGENEENISEQGKQANVRARMLQRTAVPTDLLGTLVLGDGRGPHGQRPSGRHAAGPVG
jgi:NAD(P)-dependent dehydrogenase (short-subunit alcohol dehydrogenase family)